jgi:hypothetical protein
MTWDTTQLIWTPVGQPAITLATGSHLANGTLNPYRLTGLDGLGPSSAKYVSVKTPGKRGVTHLDVKVDHRVISATFLIQGTDGNDLWVKRAAFATSMAQVPLEALASLVEGTIKLVRGGGLADLQLSGGVTHLSMPMTARQSAGVIACDIEWECGDPWWTPTSDTTTSVPTASTPVNCQNTGDGVAYVKYVIGPMTNPIITNVTTGAVFKINNTIAVGHTLTVYAGPTITILLDGVTNWAKYLDHTSRYVTHLAVGANNIQWSGSSATGALSVVYRPAVRGA